MGLKVNIESLNETIISDVSIDELESRLEAEELSVRTEMWTTCSCNAECPSYNSCSCLCPCFNMNCTETPICPPQGPCQRYGC